MATQHTQALEKRAAELASEVAALIRQETELLILVNDPQCGKPGHGYKAARKAKRQLVALESQRAAFGERYNDYLNGSKAGPKTRQQRVDKFQIALTAALQ